MNEDRADKTAIRKKRLRYQSWHRGCKETDIILGSFCDHFLSTLQGKELDLFEALLGEDDADIYKWVTGTTSPMNKAYLPLIAQLKNFREYAPV